MGAHPMDAHVGKRLRLRRSMLGMSQEALGNSIGVTFQQVQKYERGINRVGAGRLYDFSKIMNVPVSYFFEGFSDGDEVSHVEGYKEEGEQAIEYDELASKESLALVRAFHKIKSPIVKKRVLSLVKALGDSEMDFTAE